MKVIVLTAGNPSLRYAAQLRALNDLGLDPLCIGFNGWRPPVDKVARHIRMLRKKGPAGYIGWWYNNRSGSMYRHEVYERVRSALIDDDRVKAEFKPRRTFRWFSDESIKYIVNEKPDFLFQLGVGIVPEYFISRVPLILNMHPSILPGVRGLDPIFWAHYHGREDWMGSTLHLIDAGIDTGKPLLRKRLAIKKGSHYADAVISQVTLEQEMIRLFFSNYPDGYSKLDCGGSAISVYRSTWTRAQYERLQKAGWWEAEPLQEPQQPPQISTHEITGSGLRDSRIENLLPAKW